MVVSWKTYYGYLAHLGTFCNRCAFALKLTIFKLNTNSDLLGILGPWRNVKSHILLNATNLIN